MLYHTPEYKVRGDVPEHNIFSESLSSQPRKLDPRKYTVVEGKAVDFPDLGKIHHAQLNFKADGSGEYELEDGKRLDVECALLVLLTRRDVIDSVKERLERIHG